MVKINPMLDGSYGTGPYIKKNDRLAENRAEKPSIRVPTQL